MKEIIEEVDSVFGDTSNRRFDRLKRALNKFNDKWTNTEPGPLQLKSIRTLLK